MKMNKRLLERVRSDIKGEFDMLGDELVTFSNYDLFPSPKLVKAWAKQLHEMAEDIELFDKSIRGEGK